MDNLHYQTATLPLISQQPGCHSKISQGWMYCVKQSRAGGIVLVIDSIKCCGCWSGQMLRMLQQQDLSMMVFLKIYSTSSSSWCSRSGLFPLIKLSMSTTYHGPNRYFPIHSTSVSSLYLDSRKGGAIIWFSITTRCSQVLSYWGTGISETVSLRGVLTSTSILSTIFSQPLQTVLLVSGSMNFSLSSVRYLGVQVTSPNSLSSAYLWYWEGCSFSVRWTESPLTIMASTILQLSFMPSRQLFSQLTFKVYPFFLVYSSAAKARSLNPFSQYSSMKEVLRSSMAQRLALYILRRQSVMVVGWMRQQLMTLSGRQPQDQWYVLRLTPHRMKGILSFFDSSILSSSCLFLRSSSLSLSDSLTYSLGMTLQTEQMPPSGQCGLLISGMMLSNPLPSLLIRYRLLLLLSANAYAPCALALSPDHPTSRPILANFCKFLLIIIFGWDCNIIFQLASKAPDSHLHF